MNYFNQRAAELYDEMVRNRRHIHQNAEVGMNLPKTVAYVKQELASYGYDNVQEIAGGVTCTAGNGGKVLLIRGDMDALSQVEDTGLPYACTTGACHSCGHDMHTAMLLAAAKMLKEKEAELNNTIKFMFQAGEEELEGAKAMIEAGILENPHVDCAMAMHNGNTKTGIIRYSYSNARGATGFKVLVHGKGCHGGRPYIGVSAASAAANILTISQQILGMEIEPGGTDSLTFGRIDAGKAANIIPGEAVLEGTIRSINNETLAFMKSRFVEVVENVARALRTTVDIEFNPDTVALENNKELVDEFKNYIFEICPEAEEDKSLRFCDDFAAFSVLVPSLYIFIGAGSPEEGYTVPAHNPKFMRDEEAMKVGAATYANCAYRWAQNPR